MANHVLLLGAGFTRNWGGPLADELNGSLLNDVHDDLVLRDALLRVPFEEAFGELVRRADDPVEAKRLQRLQTAIEELFQRLNKSFTPRTFEFPDEDGLLIAGHGVSDFLTRFSAIFTLNQDLLLETCYMRQGGVRPSVVIPGMSFRYKPGASSYDGPTAAVWRPEGSTRVPPRSQPIFKLHGSSNWTDGGGNPVLIIGSEKSGVIQRYPVLRDYHAEFAHRLNQPDTRLMVIGYGFQDKHINSVIDDATQKSGLLTFVVDPRGRNAMCDRVWTLSGEVFTPKLNISLIGETRRPLSEFMGRPDSFAYGELMRFFQ